MGSQVCCQTKLPTLVQSIKVEPSAPLHPPDYQEQEDGKATRDEQGKSEDVIGGAFAGFAAKTAAADLAPVEESAGGAEISSRPSATPTWMLSEEPLDRKTGRGASKISLRRQTSITLGDRPPSPPPEASKGSNGSALDVMRQPKKSLRGGVRPAAQDVSATTLKKAAGRGQTPVAPSAAWAALPVVAKDGGQHPVVPAPAQTLMGKLPSRQTFDEAYEGRNSYQLTPVNSVMNSERNPWDDSNLLEEANLLDEAH